MLLRSSSTPSFTSCLQQNPENLLHRNLKSPTFSLHSPINNITRSSSDTDLLTYTHSSRRDSLNTTNRFISLEEDVEIDEIESQGLMFSTSGLDVDDDDECRIHVMVDGTGGGGDGGGKICSGGGGGGDNGDYGSDGADVYYRNMIDANPSNSLILGNYAKYLKEVLISYQSYTYVYTLFTRSRFNVPVSWLCDCGFEFCLMICIRCVVML